VQIRDYVLRRLMVLPLLIIGVSIIVFALTRIGGSPIGIYLSHEMSREEVAQLEEKFHLNDPVPVQYWYWASGVLTGDLGWSGVAAAPVTDVFPDKLAATMELAIASAVVAVSMGIALGTFAGARRNRIPDHITRVVSISGAAMPLFWFAILLLIVFWVYLGWFPIGRSDPVIWDTIDAARAKGLPERLVLRRHARRNALIPTVTVIGLSFGFLLQGTVVAEIIFRWPGLGRWMADSVLRGDQATIMAYVLFTSVLFLAVNLVVDVIYAYLDRRVVLGT
jgi:ABC-type dipeptide/oligopeptide/nickel transport system permease component